MDIMLNCKLHFSPQHPILLCSTVLHPYLNKKYDEHHHINKKGRAHSQATDVIIKRKIIVKNEIAIFRKGKKRV